MRAHSLEMNLWAAGQCWGEINSLAEVHLHQCSSVGNTQEELEAIMQQQSSDIVAVTEL